MATTHNDVMDHPAVLPISHACIRDCSRCGQVQLREPVLFAQYIRESIRFPEKPVDCQRTKVDLSCFFGGSDFAKQDEVKSRPTLVTIQKGARE